MSEALTIITRRQLQVARLIARGFVEKEIAAELGIALATVKSHRKRLYRRVGVHSANELTIWAVKNGIVTEDEVLER